MAKVLPDDDRNRRIPQSKNEGSFDRDLFETLKENIRQQNQTEDRVEALEEESPGSSESAEAFADAVDQLAGRIDTANERIGAFEEELESVKEEREIPDLTEDLTVNSRAVGDVSSPRSGVLRAENGALFGRGEGPGRPSWRSVGARSLLPGTESTRSADRALQHGRKGGPGRAV